MAGRTSPGRALVEPANQPSIVFPGASLHGKTATGGGTPPQTTPPLPVDGCGPGCCQKIRKVRTGNPLTTTDAPARPRPGPASSRSSPPQRRSTVAQPEASAAATGGAQGKRRSSFRVAVLEIRLSVMAYSGHSAGLWFRSALPLKADI